MQIALAAAIVEILFDVTAPMRAESLVRVLFCTGITHNGEPMPVKLITAALNELVVAGRVERVMTMVGAAHYRVMNGGTA